MEFLLKGWISRKLFGRGIRYIRLPEPMIRQRRLTEIVPKKFILKILTAGEGGVGKTTLLHRYVEGKFSAETKMTIGVEFFLKETDIEGNTATLQLWDFGGQERFRFLLESYVLGAKGALLMFDLTRPITLDNLEQWIDIVRKGDPDLPVLFIGTKLDLVDEIMVDD
ncbi:MAG: Rab family GTPase, partial [Promethearchaeota archaeon]